MSHLLNADRIGLTRGDRRLLDGISLGLDDGDRVGVVGVNGDGKSSLLGVLAGTIPPDEGRVTHRADLAVGALAQHDRLPDTDPAGRPATVGTVVLGGALDDPTHTWAGDVLVREVLNGLLGDLAVGSGDLEARLAVPVAHLSGGQRRRVALAAVLVGRHDVVLLDEPTNHLDVAGVAWLAEHLRVRWPAGRGGLLVVTHDRWFLDAVCSSMWEVHDGEVDAYEGGYAAYGLARAERSRVAAATEARRQNLLRKELAWLRRGAPARTSKPKFRIQAADALIADTPPPRHQVELMAAAAARLGNDVLDLDRVALAPGGPVTDGSGDPGADSAGVGSPSTGSDHGDLVLLDATWSLGAGDRVGIVGINGSGKTTVLRLLDGRLAPVSGRVRRGRTVRTALLTQHLDELAPVSGLRVIDALEADREWMSVGERTVTPVQLLDRLGFAGGRGRTRVDELSGGERRRLQLARLLLEEPNVLLLDEPTNDLDIDSLAAMEDLLDGFAGSLVVVSHDRYFLERVCDRQVGLMGDGRITDLPGGIDQYLGRLAAGGGAAERSGGSGAVGSGSVGSGGSSPAPASSAADSRAARKAMARLERALERLDDRRAGIEQAMAEAATDHERLMELDTERRALDAERDQIEDEWLEVAERADQATSPSP
ncbi:MAG: ABC-F family ATP-binding cassette domain-containing protein [Acidimicrobiales bacterium]